MTITKSEITGVIKGVFLTIGGLLIAIPLRDKLIEISPTHNTYIIGAAIMVLVLFWDN